MILAQLGLIPSWQASPNNPPNININPHVRYPEGWTQMTTQPVGPDYAPPLGFDGLGRMAVARRGCCDSGNCDCGGVDPCCDGGYSALFLQTGMTPRMLMQRQAAGARMVATSGMHGAFDSPLWANRKWLVLGGVALLGLAILGGATALLR